MGDYEGGIIASRYLNNNKEREIYLDIFSASTDVDITYVRITNQPLFTDSSPQGIMLLTILLTILAML